jgi:hypothetical protein
MKKLNKTSKPKKRKNKKNNFQRLTNELRRLRMDYEFIQALRRDQS